MGTEIDWDDSNARSARASIFEAIATREEIVLFFGAGESPGGVGEEATVRATNRVILSPFLVKRLAIRLDRALKEYEAKAGPIEGQETPVPWPAATVPPGERPRFAEKADLLLHLVKDGGVPYGLEASFKMLQNTLLENRFVLGVNRIVLERIAHGRIAEICEGMQMPAGLLRAFRHQLPRASYVGFGFEEDDKTCLYKVYLEFPGGFEAARDQVASESFVSHLGFKWDIADDTRQATARYIWHVDLPVSDILARVRRMLGAHGNGESLAMVESFVRWASERISQRNMRYLEVTEEGNPRRSFVINLYEAELRLEELHPYLVKMAQHYSIPDERFRPLYERIKTKTFGHISGGIDRRGRDFSTVYYRVKRLGGDPDAPGRRLDGASP